MKAIILDSGSIISLALNNLLHLLEDTYTRFGMRFYITGSVRKEVIENPLKTKKFKLEALQFAALLRKGIIKLIMDPNISDSTVKMLDCANNCFVARGRSLTLLHTAEVSAMSAYKHLKADAIMIDERTTRYLVEKPDRLRFVLSHKLHTKIEVNKKKLSAFKILTKNIKFIRSVEYVSVCFEKGLLDYLQPPMASKEILLDALLWGLKLNGCAISQRDLEVLKREELRIVT